MYEELLARARAAEFALQEPAARFRHEYREHLAFERAQRRLAEARRRVALAAARMMPAR